MTDQVIIQRENVTPGQRIIAATFTDITAVPFVDAVWVTAGLKITFDGTLTEEAKQAIRMRVKSGGSSEKEQLLTQSQTAYTDNGTFEALYPTTPTFDSLSANDAAILTDFVNQVLALTRQSQGYIELNSLPDPAVSGDDVI